MNRRYNLLAVGAGGLALLAIPGAIASSRVSPRWHGSTSAVQPPPRELLAPGPEFGVTVDTNARTVVYRLALTNISDEPLTVVSAGHSLPGLQLLEGRQQGVRIAQHDNGNILLKYRVVDCQAVPAGAPRMPIVVRVEGQRVTTSIVPNGSGPGASWIPELTSGVCSLRR